jgi:hypothetical protein
VSNIPEDSRVSLAQLEVLGPNMTRWRPPAGLSSFTLFSLASLHYRCIGQSLEVVA